MGLCKYALESCALNMYVRGFGGILPRLLGVFPIIFDELLYILGSTTPGHPNVYGFFFLLSIVLSCSRCPTQPPS
jgi:hypothetical protein